MECDRLGNCRGPARGGGGSHVARLNFKTSRVGVFKCLLLIVGSLAEGGCLLLRFHFTCCCYLFGHVACQNLPWQGLIVVRNRTFVDSDWRFDNLYS